MAEEDRCTLLITQGDPAGIGSEIVLKALVEPDLSTICRPIVTSEGWVLSKVFRRLRLKSQIYRIVDPTRPASEAGLSPYVRLPSA